MKAFTIGFSGEGTAAADETADAGETSDIIGFRHHIARIGARQYLDAVQKCVSIVEEPLATTSIVPMYFLSELASNHVKVVLSGQGADETLGGYGRYQGELLHRFVPAFAARAIQKVLEISGSRNERLLRGTDALSRNNDLDRFFSAYQVFSQAEIDELLGFRSKNYGREELEYFYHLLQCESLEQSASRMMMLDTRLNLADDLLLYTDKITMHHSIECRVPMLDIELVDFIQSLPLEYKLKFGKTKIIHKSYSEQMLPASIINRKKKGFLSPTREWFKKGSDVWDLLQDPGSRFSSFFSVSAVRKILDEHHEGYARDRHVFLLLCLYYWLEEFG